MHLIRFCIFDHESRAICKSKDPVSEHTPVANAFCSRRQVKEYFRRNICGYKRTVLLENELECAGIPWKVRRRKPVGSDILVHLECGGLDLPGADHIGLRKRPLERLRPACHLK